MDLMEEGRGTYSAKELGTESCLFFLFLFYRTCLLNTLQPVISAREIVKNSTELHPIPVKSTYKIKQRKSVCAGACNLQVLIAL